MADVFTKAEMTDTEVTKDILQIAMEKSVPKEVIYYINTRLLASAKVGLNTMIIDFKEGTSDILSKMIVNKTAVTIYYERRGISVGFYQKLSYEWTVSFHW